MHRALLGLALLACVAGLFFTGFSTFDFLQHLDRQVHGIHCSFVPGLEGTDVSGDSGCHVTLMSPYSSILRGMIWGGVPISLPGMAVFGFLLAYGLDLFLGDRARDRSATGFFALATALPALTSLVMGYLSLVTLDAACKLCIGTYVASAGALIGATGLWMQNRKGGWEADGGDSAPEDTNDDDSDIDWTPTGGFRGLGSHAVAFATGVGFVVAAVGGYIALAPDFSGYVGTCGELSAPEDPNGVLIPIGGAGEAAAIEVLDPLCPSCRGLEDRLNASDLGDRLSRRVLLFPLDDSCNWMVNSAVHPGACTISEAMICASDIDSARAEAVMHWAFDEQDTIKAAMEADAGSAKRLVLGAFPELQGCVGSKKIRSRLNRSLRWAVANELPVLTPQLYVDGVKLCDEDTDLGLDFALTRLLDARAAGTLGN